MKILSWNVHFDLKKEQIPHIDSFNADIIILQEVTPKGFDLLKDKYKNSFHYADTLYENNANYGIAIFSDNYDIKFTDNFNRNFRYVVPLEIHKPNSEDSFLFYLFAVWTKKLPINYTQNIIQACDFDGYQKYIADKAIFIGDFNTPDTKQQHSKYDAIIAKGLIDCADDKDILKPTYSHSTGVDYFSADYCLATPKMKDSFTIKETIFDLDDSIDIKDKYLRLSDHVPLLVEIE